MANNVNSGAPQGNYPVNDNNASSQSTSTRSSSPMQRRVLQPHSPYEQGSASQVADEVDSVFRACEQISLDQASAASISDEVDLLLDVRNEVNFPNARGDFNMIQSCALSQEIFQSNMHSQQEQETQACGAIQSARIMGDLRAETTRREAADHARIEEMQRRDEFRRNVEGDSRTAFLEMGEGIRELARARSPRESGPIIDPISGLIINPISGPIINPIMKRVERLPYRVYPRGSEGNRHLSTTTNQGLWLASANRFEMRRDEIAASPTSALYAITEVIIEQKITRISMRLLDDQGRPMAGVDQGGPGREVIDTIISSISQEMPEAFQLMTGTGLYLPKSGQKNGQYRELMTYIGVLLAFCFNTNRQQGGQDNYEYLIGALFEHTLFEVLKSWGEAELQGKEMPVFEGNEERYRQLYESLFRQDEAGSRFLKKLKSYRGDLEKMGDALLTEALYYAYDGDADNFPDEFKTDDSLDLEKVRANTSSLKALIEKRVRSALEEMAKEQLSPIFWMAQGMYRALKDYNVSWNHVQAMSDEALCDLLQGKIGSRDIIAKLRFTGVGELHSTLLKEVIEWATEEEKKELLQAVTGAKRLGKKEIEVIQSSLFVSQFHTCWNRLDLHSVDETLEGKSHKAWSALGEKEREQLYETFKEKLFLAVRQGNKEGFGMV